MKTRRRLLLVLCLVALISGSATVAFAASTPLLTSWVWGAGGGPSSSGSVTNNSTLGQSVIGLSNGGAISLSAGFWHRPVVELKVYLPVVKKNKILL